MDTLSEGSQYLFRNISITISVILLLTFAVSRVIFPKMFSAVYNFSKFTSFRIKEDFGSNMRLFSTENFYFTLLLSASISFVGLNLFMFSASLPEYLSWIVPSNFGSGLLIWLLLTISVQLLFLLKFLFLSAFGGLFALPLSVSKHYQEVQALNNCFVLLLLATCTITIYSNYYFPPDLTGVLMTTVVIYLLYRLLNIFFKLWQLKLYSKLYIFSYLCTTEILPTVIGFKLLFN
ncbi:DUF4271 domain-containing protein [Roseivirga misakiensis]|uniref:DUF4271 domain-containing protein n=1 Tax=Roseivirga misakiensis TaxID=1563681 RepID=A0A1E5T6A0_9BACT|nr:DUF4271 domain-containing protein [Roseivirga misakiensis]OEK06876.1 hypothetical protein BFP71_04265 [Roseivirga misakiensis]